MRRIVAAYLAITAAGLVFLTGIYVGHAKFPLSGTFNTVVSGEGKVRNRNAPPPYLLQDVDFALFWDVWQLVKNHYLEQPVRDSQLFYGALAGIVASLGDPYTTFLDPETTAKFSRELAGRFEGIGAEIGIKKEQLVIVAPLPDTPAERAGLKAGDKILRIDDKDTTGMPIEVAVSNIRGKRGTTVVLKILRNGWKEPRDISIIRAAIQVESVTWKMRDDKVAYLKITNFNETTVPLFEEATRAILARDPQGLIVDLRNNPGGFLDGALRVASEWIPRGGTVVIQRLQGNEQNELRAQGLARFEGTPTVVLINPGTASGAEIVAGALQDHKKATLVGEKTFGKGSVQDWEQLQGGSSVKITIAEWLTPTRRKINGEGVAPDFEVKLEREEYDDDRDPQLEKAVELLSK